MSIVASKNKYEKGISLISSFLWKKENFDTEDLEYIKNKKGNQFFCMHFLSSDYDRISSINLLIEKKVKNHRLNCYIGGKLRILGNDKSSRLFTQAS